MRKRGVVEQNDLLDPDAVEKITDLRLGAFLFEQSGEEAFFFVFLHFFLSAVGKESTDGISQTRIDEAVGYCGGHQVYLRHSV